MSHWEGYIKDVLNGKRITGKLERLAVERFESLRKKKEYYFDKEEVEEKLHIVSLFKHTKGKFKGVNFKPMPWQSFFWAYMFGIKYRDTELRVVQEVLLSMAKKGGKSEMAGATAVLMTFFDNEPGAESYSAANSSDQALFSWNAGKVIVQQLMQDHPDHFGQNIKIYDSFNNRTIKDLSTDSFFKAISAETRTLDGVNPHCAIVDEFHESRTDDIPKNLKSGMVGREQPILMFVTTRGFIINGELRKLENKHIGLLKNRFTDDSSMSMIFSFDPKDEAKLKKYWGKPINDIDKTFWTKSNPGLGVAPTQKGIETMYTDAINEGQSAQVNVMVKNFNIWVRQSKTWLSIEYWNKCRKKIDISKLKGRECYGAYDLSHRWDLTAVGLLFPPVESEKDFLFHCKYYCPEEGIKFRANRDKVPYTEWVADGLLIATPGNVIDYDYIREDIMRMHEDFEVMSWQYDPMFATEISTKLSESGLNVESFRQTVVTYNEPILKLEELILKSRLNTGSDVILDWMFENIAINQNRSGLKMFDKDKSQEKIDGMVCMAMAMGGYLGREEKTESVYSSRGIRTI
jgi:phage terminase large subunit-like protein